MTGLTDLDVQDDPFEYYRERRAECPVWHEPDLDQFVVGGLAEARGVLTDPVAFSSRPSPRRRSGSEAAIAYQQVLQERGWPRILTLQRLDPPAHTRHRVMLNRVFSAPRVRELTPRIDQIVTDLIDAFIDRGTCEFVSEFAVPMPGTLIAEELGLDRTEYQRFRRWADAMLSLAQRPTMSVDEAIAEAEVELEAQHYLAEEFERRRAAPTDDLISMLVHAHADDEQPLSMGELQDLMHQLITGGYETTTAALTTGLWLLLTYPDQMAMLRAEPALMKNFIEESLRFDSPVQGLWRTTTCPVDVAGVTVPEGASVMVRYGAANRDDRQFDDPDTFDIRRGNARHHVAFGLGAHYCVGAALARQELFSSFTRLLDRLQDIELAEPLPERVHEPSIFLRPMKRLPLRFAAA